MHDATHDEKAHLVVGIEVDGEVDAVMREAGTVAYDAADDGAPVDLVRVVRGEGGLGEYFVASVEPFFTRA